MNIFRKFQGFLFNFSWYCLLFHFYLRLFKGPVVQTDEIHGYPFRTYKSGYRDLEYLPGRFLDVWLAERRQVYIWTALGTKGVGGYKTLPMRQVDAIKHVSEVSGSVIYVDKDNHHIFYRQKER